MTNDKPSATLWGLPIVEVEPEPEQHTGEFFAEYVIAAEFSDHPSRQYSDDRAVADLGRRIGKAMSDGRAYHVMMEREERTEHHPITYQPDRTFIKYKATVALVNYEDAEVGEIALSIEGVRFNLITLAVKNSQRLFRVSDAYMVRML